MNPLIFSRKDMRGIFPLLAPGTPPQCRGKGALAAPTMGVDTLATIVGLDNPLEH